MACLRASAFAASVIVSVVAAATFAATALVSTFAVVLAGVIDAGGAAAGVLRRPYSIGTFTP
jgi:hypothetical protein